MTDANYSNDALDSTTNPSHAKKDTVMELRDKYYGELPKKYKQHPAFKEFYNEALSLKLFSYFVLYFCALFKLEARRKKYEASQAKNDGRTFSEAHARTRSIFLQLTQCYAAILLRYGCFAAIKQNAKFQFRDDELIFYEVLYWMCSKVLRDVFSDDRLHTCIDEQINKIFRSRSFDFRYEKQQREWDTLRSRLLLDRGKGDLPTKNDKMASILIAPLPKVHLQHAMQQRSSLVGCRFPDKTQCLNYQAPPPDLMPNKAPPKPPKCTEYFVQTRMSPFPTQHRAQSRLEHERALKTPVKAASPSPGLRQGPRAPFEPKPKAVLAMLPDLGEDGLMRTGNGVRKMDPSTLSSQRQKSVFQPSHRNTSMGAIPNVLHAIHNMGRKSTGGGMNGEKKGSEKGIQIGSLQCEVSRKARVHINVLYGYEDDQHTESPAEHRRYLLLRRSETEIAFLEFHRLHAFNGLSEVQAVNHLRQTEPVLEDYASLDVPQDVMLEYDDEGILYVD